MISLPWLRNKCETKVGEPTAGHQENLLPPDQQGEAEKPRKSCAFKAYFAFSTQSAWGTHKHPVWKMLLHVQGKAFRLCGLKFLQDPAFL